MPKAPKIEHDEQRAKEPVSEVLVRILMVPEIYWDAEWPQPGSRVDVLAVDRSGSGAVHIVEIKRSRTEALRAVSRIMAIPAQFRWIAFFGRGKPDGIRAAMDIDQLFPQEGPGRVGVIVVIRLPNGDLEASVVVKAERFSGSYRDETKRFAASHKPDISFDY